MLWLNQRIPYLFSFGLAKCFTQNFIHHQQSFLIFHDSLKIFLRLQYFVSSFYGIIIFKFKKGFDKKWI
ncbi:hypothetical protein EW027_17870 [Aeribacillus pallidus]|nr:hypothetical protein EW027_17870 [Aeribacillus pallidus]